LSGANTRTVVWFQAGGCTGCSISLMNADYPDLANLLLDEVVPGKGIALKFHATLMGPTGRPALEALERIPEKEAGEYLLVVEGAIPTAAGGRFGMVGEVPMAQRAASLARRAQAVLALGTCASYGGIPAGVPNPAGCVGVGELLRREGIQVPVVNVPGCPPHPRWFVETAARVLLGLPGPEELDEAGRLKAVYRGLIHESCPRRPDFDVGRFAPSFGEEGCLYELGCKGPFTESQCPQRGWNGGVSWCIAAGHPCIGCTEPDFLDRFSPLFRKLSLEEEQQAYRRAR